MQKYFLLLSFLFPASIYAQININKSKASIIKETTDYQKKNSSYSIDTNETDSTLWIVEINPEKNRTEHLLQFDKANKCMLESFQFKCDSCYNKKLSELLAIKKYNWKKINGNQYISNFESRLMIEVLYEETSKILKIIRTDWSKLLYDMLSGK